MTQRHTIGCPPIPWTAGTETTTAIVARLESDARAAVERYQRENGGRHIHRDCLTLDDIDALAPELNRARLGANRWFPGAT